MLTLLIELIVKRIAFFHLHFKSQFLKQIIHILFCYYFIRLVMRMVLEEGLGLSRLQHFKIDFITIAELILQMLS